MTIEKEIKDITKELEVTEEMLNSYNQLSKELDNEISEELKESMLISFKALLNDYHKPFRDMVSLLVDMRKEAEIASKVNLEVTLFDIENAKATKKQLEADIKALREEHDKLYYKIQKASLSSIIERIKNSTGVFIVIALLLLGGVWYESKHVTDKVIATISNEYESLYTTFQKREEIQKSVEAWDDYHAYCLEKYVECPLFSSCEEAKQKYTDEIFIKKFGNRPGTIVEE